MSVRDAVNQAFPPVMTTVVLAAFGVQLALDWVSLAKGDKDTSGRITAIATTAWLVAILFGVYAWTT
jgi:xanthine/uracil permease